MRKLLGILGLLALLVYPCFVLGQTGASANCEQRATPPPMATFGGPTTAAPDHTEVGIAVGVFGEGFDAPPCVVDMLGASNWLARWRRGLSSRTDLGFDLLIASNQTILAGTTKAAMPYQATKGLRLEGGVGFSDGGTGRSVNADLAAVIGTYKHPENTWNYYASLRLGGSHGCNSLLCIGSPGPPGSDPPGALIPLGAIGATARVSDTTRFVMEGGLGEHISRQQPSSGMYLHISFGVLFNVGKDRKREVRRAPLSLLMESGKPQIATAPAL